MLNMIIWIFLIAAILLVLYYLGYLLISIVRKSFKSSASKQSPQIVAKPPVSLDAVFYIRYNYCFIILLYYLSRMADSNIIKESPTNRI